MKNSPSQAHTEDTAGALVEYYRYDQHGFPRYYADSNEEQSASTINNPFLLHGRRWDTDQNLYYYRNRFYSPELGRFIHRDPLGMVDGPNQFVYCGNNPINAVDPKGLDWIADLNAWGLDIEQRLDRWLATKPKIPENLEVPIALYEIIGGIGDASEKAGDALTKLIYDTADAVKAVVKDPSLLHEVSPPVLFENNIKNIIILERDTRQTRRNFARNITHPTELLLSISDNKRAFGGVLFHSALLLSVAAQPETQLVTIQVAGAEETSGLNGIILSIPKAGDTIVKDSTIEFSNALGLDAYTLETLATAPDTEILYVIAHGSPIEVGNLSAEELAFYLKSASKKPLDIRLLSCEAGKGNYLEELSALTGARVEGTEHIVDILEGIKGTPQVRQGGQLLLPGQGWRFCGPPLPGE